MPHDLKSKAKREVLEGLIRETQKRIYALELQARSAKKTNNERRLEQITDQMTPLLGDMETYEEEMEKIKADLAENS